MTQETLDKAIQLKNDCDRVDNLLVFIKEKRDDVREDYFEVMFRRVNKTDRQLIDAIIEWLQNKGIELREEIENL